MLTGVRSNGAAMTFFTWSDQMSVGVDLIDSDHKALIALINELHEAFENGDEPELPSDTFGRLIDYIDHHFLREEAVMEACGYPGVRQHKTEHGRFTHEIRYIQDRYVRGEETKAGEDLLNYLKVWLRRHILVDDMAYRPYAEGNEEAIDVADNYGPGLNEAAEAGKG
jgi:hemerythrin